MKSHFGDHIKFMTDIPENPLKQMGWENRNSQSPPIVLVIDDLMENLMMKKAKILQLWTGISHHKNIHVILLSQFMFLPSSPIFKMLATQINCWVNVTNAPLTIYVLTF